MTWLSASSRSWALSLGSSRRGASRKLDRCRVIMLGLALPLPLALCSCLLCRRIPVVDHLKSQDGIQGESGNEPIQNELIVDLLQRCEDS